MPLSRAQQGKFRPLARQAWLRHCLTKDLNESDRDGEREWYERQLFDVLGARSTKDVSITPDRYHDLMLHFAQLAKDEKWLSRLATEQERRMRWLIGQRLDAIAHLEGKPVPWEYAVATYVHMDLPLTLEDTPAEYLYKVFQALDTHVRRLLRRAGLTMRELKHRMAHPGSVPRCGPE